MSSINIAVTGCGHGELDAFYRMCSVFEENGSKVDLLIITGDFQAMRNQEDLGCMKCPFKYMFMRDFYKYYSGEKVAPVLTIYIGGNHEASNYHRELHFGGWVAPNIYYMGASNVIRYKGLTIGGISGIFKSNDFEKGYYETIPFPPMSDDPASIYHYRRYEINKLLSYPNRIDIMLSHDWPSRMFQYGDVQSLLKWKPHFQQDVNNMCLGSPPLMDVLDALHPSYWFASHLHVKYPAIYPHVSSISPTDPTEPPVETTIPEVVGTTRFLALDKCLRGRHFIQLVTIPIDEAHKNETDLYYDEDWLSIVKNSYSYLSSSINRVVLPSKFSLSEKRNPIDLRIPKNFRMIAPLYIGSPSDRYDASEAVSRGNNQTDDYLHMLGLDHVITMPLQDETLLCPEDPNGIDIDDVYSVCKQIPKKRS